MKMPDVGVVERYILDLSRGTNPEDNIKLRAMYNHVKKLHGLTDLPQETQ